MKPRGPVGLGDASPGAVCSTRTRHPGEIVLCWEGGTGDGGALISFNPAVNSLRAASAASGGLVGEPRNAHRRLQLPWASPMSWLPPFPQCINVPSYSATCAHRMPGGHRKLTGPSALFSW